MKKISKIRKFINTITPIFKKLIKWLKKVNWKNVTLIVSVVCCLFLFQQRNAYKQLSDTSLRYNMTLSQMLSIKNNIPYDTVKEWIYSGVIINSTK